MIEEPYRWIEAIKNRREYIEDQLAAGGPVVVAPCADGLLLLTLTGETQKIFEVYDRIAFAGLGHPADIERMRLAAIDLAHVEGFSRDAHDVSLRRLVSYGMSPALKNAFEQVFSAPFIVRSVLVEIGAEPAQDLIVKLDYDGSFGRGESDAKSAVEVLAGTKAAEDRMRQSLAAAALGATTPLAAAVRAAALAWAAGLAPESEDVTDEPGLAKLYKDLSRNRRVEAAALERPAARAARFRWLDEKELRAALKEL